MPKFTIAIDMGKPFFHQMDGESLDIECLTYAIREIADMIDAQDAAEAPIYEVLNGMAYDGHMVLGTYKVDE